MNNVVATYDDWAAASEPFDILASKVLDKDLSLINEAQTRYDVIDGLIRDVLGWQTGQVAVEEHTKTKNGYVDYILSVGDKKIIIEAKKYGATFPNPTKKTRLKLSGSVLGQGEVSDAIRQAEAYAADKKADLVCVTNGSFWCFFATKDRDENSYATILFPFEQAGHAEQLYNAISEKSVHGGSIDEITNTEPVLENRLISLLHNADARLDRNNIADHIAPALNHALYASALLGNADALEKCYVTTGGRIKFDNLLGVHLSDTKPTLSSPARRIRRSQANGPLEDLVRKSTDAAPPVTLIMGPVGAGKSTYLKHFETISGKSILSKQKARWIYVDFEAMGQAGDPREYLYTQLQDYLLNKDSNIDYETVIEPAYNELIQGLVRGPLAPIANNKEEINKRIADIIQADYTSVEPYVDRVLSYLTRQSLCVIVMDNVDLYNDEILETKVFSEGLAISKRLLCNVIVSLRDTTYVNHRNSSVFNAYELKKLWLDPPPFRQVLSSRLTYSRKILQGKSAMVSMDNGMKLNVPDLGQFFDIVQRSILQGAAGKYIENIADQDIRYGLSLVNSFLISGHIQADKALRIYLTDEGSSYSFPFHEVFKGTALGQWKYFKEARSESIINIYDSRTNAAKTRLLRVSLLRHLAEMAAAESTLNVPVADCIKLFAPAGASQADVLEVLTKLQENRLVGTASAQIISDEENVHITRSGAYYVKVLAKSFAYAEQCMFDTAIEDEETWEQISNLTILIEENRLSIADRMQLRNERILLFMEYLIKLEENMLEQLNDNPHLYVMESIATAVIQEANTALNKSIRYHS